MNATATRVHSVEPPPDLQEFLLREGGRNPYGEPMFRLVWGGNRLAWRHGRWEDKDEHGVLIREVIEPRKVPKYGFAKERFHVEVWRPAEYYGTPAEWKAQTTSIENGIACSVLGEYPSRGDYESIDVVEQVGVCECGRVVQRACDFCGRQSCYLEPSREYLGYLIRCWKASVDKVNHAMQRAAYEAKVAKEEQDKIENYVDRMRDALPAFGGAQHAVYAAPKEEGLVIT